MLRSTAFLRHLARLAPLLPGAVLVTSCFVFDGGTGGTGGKGVSAATSGSGTGGSGTGGTSTSGSGTGGTSTSGSGTSGTGGTSSSGSGTSGTGGSSTSGTGTSTGSGTGTGGDAGTGDGSVPDTTPPTVTSTFPVDASTGQPTTAAITATFNEAMAPLTLNSASFTVTHGALVIPGTVSYVNDTVTFQPTSALALSTTYTATISTVATDTDGNALAAPYTWSFTTTATQPLGPAPVLLGTAGQYAILAKSAISNVPTSVITGDLGLSPAAASFITGFSLTKAGTKWTSPQVIGSVFAADNDPPTPINLTTAVGDMQAAYTDAASRPTPNFLNLGAGAIGGLTLVPGLYKWTSGVTVPADVTISGAPDDVWIFQVTGTLKVSAAKAMILNGGARAKNIFWQVSGGVDLGTTAHAEGIMLSQTAINLGTGASINGRLLAQTAVTLAKSTVTAPSP